MFNDLQAPVIRPDPIDLARLTEVKIPVSLGSLLENMIAKEELEAVKVGEYSSVVLTGKGYIYFPNQWFLIAASCRDYALTLLPYISFWDENLRTKVNWSDDDLAQILPDKSQQKQVRYFLDTLKEMNIVNPAGTAKDIFVNMIISVLPEINQSLSYVGTIVYYLAKHPEIYKELVEWSFKTYQIPEKKLRKAVKDTAKDITDYIFALDKFSRLEDYFEYNPKYVQVRPKPEIFEAPWFEPNALTYFLCRPGSNGYIPKITDHQERVFKETDYTWIVEHGPEAGDEVTCRLTTQWKGNSEISKKGGNHLFAYVDIINRLYKDFLCIEKKEDTYYLYPAKKENKVEPKHFELNILPKEFQEDFGRRYITSLLAKPFVILTGNSGTGKTRTAKRFAEYLEVLDEEGKKNWLLVPVGADWTDNTKLLGFFNPLANEGKGTYVKTEALDLIERANAHPDVPYFLILDEMNLSHVERYFSDFLSHMETPGLPMVLDGLDHLVDYPDNLFVVGTVNIDETTYMFSPKVLDRANVLEFKPEESSVLDEFDKPVSLADMEKAPFGMAEGFLALSRKVRSGESGVRPEDMAVVKECFGKAYEILKGADFEFAYRTVREIRQYVQAAQLLEEVPAEDWRTRAEDEALLQKVLPKIYGNKKEIQNLLAELKKLTTETYQLPSSAAKIEQMEKKLANVQYASFM